jgi:hypothetical protein
MSSCPGSFYQGGGSNPAVCYGANVSCPSANPIGLTFSYINGNAPNTPKGTIVLFNGGGGEMTLMDNNDGMASDYATANTRSCRPHGQRIGRTQTTASE